MYFHFYCKWRCFWRNLHCWQKVYTAAGSDGMNKSHLWWGICFLFRSGATENEEKVILVSENDPFLTLGSGTSSARNKNLRLLQNTKIPLISGKYGHRNHFWPLERRFFMRKSEKKGPNSKSSRGRILISWNPILYTFLCTKIKKNTMDNFFS